MSHTFFQMKMSVCENVKVCVGVYILIQYVFQIKGGIPVFLFEILAYLFMRINSIMWYAEFLQLFGRWISINFFPVHKDCLRNTVSFFIDFQLAVPL